MVILTLLQPAIPRAPEDDEDMDDIDYEDEDTFGNHAHNLSDSVSLQLAPETQISVARRREAAKRASP